MQAIDVVCNYCGAEEGEECKGRTSFGKVHATRMEELRKQRGA